MVERGQQRRHHDLRARAPSLSFAATTSPFSTFSVAPSLWSPNRALLPGEVVTAECKGRPYCGC